ncbi:hypothetical protein [Tabrizicola oligotrophica]|nr:hypothetical protein [Tabrizicola oligotrophica]
MSSTKILLSLCLVAFVAACAAAQDDVVYVEEPAVTVEPTYTGKYK